MIILVLVIILLLLVYDNFNNNYEYMTNSKLVTKINNDDYYLSIDDPNIECDNCINKIVVLDKIGKSVDIRTIDPEKNYKKLYIDNNILLFEYNNDICAESKYLNPKKSEIVIDKLKDGIKLKIDGKFIEQCKKSNCKDNKIRLCVGENGLIFNEK